MPSINALGRELEREGLTVLLVDIGEDRATVERAARSRGYTARILLDLDRKVTEVYAVRATPTTFLVGRDGTLRGRAIGPRPWTGPDGRALLRSLLAEPAPPGEAVTPELEQALRVARYMYLTTYSQAGNPGTVPVWLWLHDGAVYFTTQRASLKARRIRQNGRVSVRVGRKDGPAFEGRAEWVDDRPDLEAALLAAYRRKYPLMVPLWMGRRIRRGLAAKTSVLIRLTPLAAREPA